ncbi:MAG: UDP-N-acetylmuramate--L-alanine ligase [Spirochaetes bacterium]|nr:UDP-N-acetylmuramate--L-alanine ligase [Spirochaetota bacterium]
MFRKSEKMHFLGIGGIGMSGIAEILVNLGYKVSGSDIHESDITRRLASLGVKIFTGHNSSNIEDHCVVVTSTAIDQDNPEIIEARKRRIPIIHRSEMLAELIRMKQGIGVAGTHGKTTTSSLLSWILFKGGINPTAIIGGKVLNFASNARIGEGDYIVFEADESDGSFLRLLPTITIVTNIDADHLDHYKSFDGLKKAFLRYINNIPFYGYSVLCMDDKVISGLLPEIERPFVTYGFSIDADFRADKVELKNERLTFDCYYKNDFLGCVESPLMGHHNVLNTLAVIAVALELGMEFNVIKDALKDFMGVGRRLEYVGEEKGILVLDDYGHHPTEIRATLQALKSKGRRIVTVFQPHRYSRTELLWEEFGSSFGNSDVVLLTGIYPAGEKPIKGISSELIKQSIEKHDGKEVNIISDFERITETVLSIVREGDIVLTLGAGDIYKAGLKIVEALKGN